MKEKDNMKTNHIKNLLKKETITGKEAGIAEIKNYIYNSQNKGKYILTLQEHNELLEHMTRTTQDIQDYNYYYHCIYAVSKTINKMETALQKTERTLSYIFLNIYNINRNLQDYYKPYITEQDITDIETFVKDKTPEEALKIKKGGIAKLIIKGEMTAQEQQYQINIPNDWADIDNFIFHASKSIEQLKAHAKAIELLAQYINIPELVKVIPSYEVTLRNANAVNNILENLETQAKETGLDIGKHKKIIIEPKLIRGYIAFAKDWLHGQTPSANITYLLYLIILNGRIQEN